MSTIPPSNGFVTQWGQSFLVDGNGGGGGGGGPPVHDYTNYFVDAFPSPGTMNQVVVLTAPYQSYPAFWSYRLDSTGAWVPLFPVRLWECNGQINQIATAVDGNTSAQHLMTSSDNASGAPTMAVQPRSLTDSLIGFGVWKNLLGVLKSAVTGSVYAIAKDASGLAIQVGTGVSGATVALSSALSIAGSGAVTIGTLVVSGTMTVASMAVSGAITAASVAASGAMSAASFAGVGNILSTGDNAAISVFGNNVGLAKKVGTYGQLVYAAGSNPFVISQSDAANIATSVSTQTYTPRLTIASGGAVSIPGATTLGSTLAVTGAATVGTTLSAGASALTSLVVSTTAAITGTLSAGASTLASLAVTGAATVGTTLAVTGAATVGTLSAGATTLASTLSVAGATTLAALSAAATSVTTLTSSAFANLSTLGVNVASSYVVGPVTGRLSVNGPAVVNGSIVGTADNSLVTMLDYNLGIVKKAGASATLAYGTGTVFKVQSSDQATLLDVTGSTFTDRFVIDAAGNATIPGTLSTTAVSVGPSSFQLKYDGTNGIQIYDLANSSPWLYQTGTTAKGVRTFNNVLDDGNGNASKSGLLTVVGTGSATSWNALGNARIGDVFGQGDWVLAFNASYTTTNYCLRQNNVGRTFLNSPTDVNLRVNNANVLSCTSTGASATNLSTTGSATVGTTLGVTGVATFNNSVLCNGLVGVGVPGTTSGRVVVATALGNPGSVDFGYTVPPANSSASARIQCIDAGNFSGDLQFLSRQPGSDNTTMLSNVTISSATGNVSTRAAVNAGTVLDAPTVTASSVQRRGSTGPLAVYSTDASRFNGVNIGRNFKQTGASANGSSVCTGVSAQQPTGSAGGVLTWNLNPFNDTSNTDYYSGYLVVSVNQNTGATSSGCAMFIAVTKRGGSSLNAVIVNTTNDGFVATTAYPTVDGSGNQVVQVAVTASSTTNVTCSWTWLLAGAG